METKQSEIEIKIGTVKGKRQWVAYCNGKIVAYGLERAKVRQNAIHATTPKKKEVKETLDLQTKVALDFFSRK